MAGGARGDRPHPALGHSGHVNEYRSGVTVGNFAEEILAADSKGRPGYLLDKGGSFLGQTTAQATYTPEGKSGAALAAVAQREDIALKYVKYGKSAVLGDDKTGFFASTTQLAYGGVAAAGAPTRVQDILWGDSKFQNRKVPVSSGADSLVQERRRQLEAEAAASPYRTVEKDCLEAAAADPQARLAAKPPMARPKDPAGEDTQTGRKASGAFKAFYDKDYLKIGLRKQGGTQPGKA